MKKIAIVIMSLLLVGCTTVKDKYHTAVNEYGKIKRDRDYTQTENFVASRVNVPQGLSDSKLQDKFTVPVVASEAKGKAPSLAPPIEKPAKG